jgi:hypothetical protein
LRKLSGAVQDAGINDRALALIVRETGPKHK